MTFAACGPCRRPSGESTSRPGTTGTSTDPLDKSWLSSSTFGWAGERCTTTLPGARGTGGSACENGRPM
eukprot:15463551-Alexandrium_andersonii.AAC.1